MTVRRAAKADREAMLRSFRPMFGDWDYLPLVIDEWLAPAATTLTWLAYAGSNDSQLVAMMQADELTPGDWYLKGLRSNPGSRPGMVGCAIFALRQVAMRELRRRRVEDVRYGTLDNNRESLRLASLLGFREHFRLAHAWHELPQIPAAAGPEPVCSTSPDELYAYFNQGLGQSPCRGYYFTWWDTRRFLPASVEAAQRLGLVFAAKDSGRLLGAALCWLVPWQRFVVFSLMEGSDQTLRELYRAGVRRAHDLGCKAIGLVHPSLAELHRRQVLFGLEPSGQDTVQLRLSRPLQPTLAAEAAGSWPSSPSGLD